MSAQQSTNQRIAIMLRNVRSEAVRAGLMTEAEQLAYEKGSPRNGIAPGVWIVPVGPTGRPRSAAAFLPRFNTKHTGKDVELALDAAYGALFAVNRKP